MIQKIKAKPSKLNQNGQAKKILSEVRDYFNAWAEIEKEYVRIPRWRVLKQRKIAKKREHLTRSCKVRMFELGFLI